MVACCEVGAVFNCIVCCYVDTHHTAMCITPCHVNVLIVLCCDVVCCVVVWCVVLWCVVLWWCVYCCEVRYGVVLCGVVVWCVV